MVDGRDTFRGDGKCDHTDAVAYQPRGDAASFGCTEDCQKVYEGQGQQGRAAAARKDKGEK